MRRRAWLGVAIVFAASLNCRAPPAFAQEVAQPSPSSKDTSLEPPPEPADAKPPADDKKKKKKKKRDLLFAPVPFSSPSTGTGVAAGAVAFYNPNHSPQQWITGGGVVLTNRDTKGLAGFHTMYLNGDRIRLNVDVSYMEGNTRFYGIGVADGDRGDALTLRNDRLNLRVRGLMRTSRHLFVGLRYRLETNDARANDDEPSLTPLPPADELKSTLSMLGPVIAYDTRDSHTQPHRGVYLGATWLFGLEELGDSYNHNKLALVGTAYFPFGTDTVLATSATLCSTGGNVPYYDLCLFGSGGALRGYPSGRYRDGASWSVQAELRHMFTKRWGGVGFFGLGGIAPSVGKFIEKGNALPAAGVGVRYLPFKNNDVHLRLDVAIGKNDHGIYLGIGEAF